MSVNPKTEKRKARIKAIAKGDIFIAGEQKRSIMFLNDWYGLIYAFPLILWRAWVDTKARYKRSILGPYWLSIGTFTFVVGYSILAGLLFQRPLKEFLGYIACGVIAWQFISTSLAEGAKLYVSNEREIGSVRVNYLGLAVKLMLKGLIGFAHSLPVVLVVVFFTDTINLNTLMVIPGILILVFTLTPIAAALGTLAARYRDLEQLVVMFNQFFFYMTPILWKAEMLGTGYGRWVAYGNPLYYALSIIRMPLMGEPVPIEIWIGAICCMLLSMVLGFSIYARFRQRIPFWI